MRLKAVNWLCTPLLALAVLGGMVLLTSATSAYAADEPAVAALEAPTAEAPAPEAPAGEDPVAPAPETPAAAPEGEPMPAGEAAPMDEKKADEPPPPTADEKVESLRTEGNILWTCIAAFLVFFMQAGFALVEAGLTRAKNTVNILMKNAMDFCIGSLAFWAVGYGLMFGTASGGFVGTDKFLFEASDNFGWAFLLFQTVFCATAATIVSGAMAERTKFSSYLIYTAIISLVIYPIFGKWAWGSLAGADASGWLCGGDFLNKVAGEGMFFHDFAGSTVVHSIGGWAALAGALVLGPRIGKYTKDGKVVPIPGHSIPFAALGVFILWLGWFGFNPGSTTALGGGNFAYIAVTTNISACAGGIAAMITAWVMFGKPDASFTLNGVLAGLVAITAGCDAMSVPFACLTGALAGVVVVFACVAFDKIGVDDPVGAISVHGVCGALGTLAIGLFKKDIGLLTGGQSGQFIAQVIGVLTAFVWAFCLSGALFLALKYTVGLRCSAEEEIEGLDMHEHGMLAYPAPWVAESDPLAMSHIDGPAAPSGKPASVSAPAPVVSGA